jgi:hypothetical protein
MTFPVQNLKKQISLKTSDRHALEVLKCRENPFYFIYNYVYVSGIGSIYKITEDNFNEKLKRTIRSLMIHHKAILMASRQLGKALSINTPILTSSGKFVKMKNIKVGDIIFGPDGKETTVVAATDIMYDHECYEIEFDYGERIHCDAEHLWEVIDYRNNSKEIYTTKELYNALNTNNSIESSLGIANPDPIDFPEKELPIDPYVFGLWLASKDTRFGSISTTDKDYQAYSEIIKEDISEFKYTRNDKSQEFGYFTINNLYDRLQENNLLEKKYIPSEYLRASIDQRIQLLCGLMDYNGEYFSKGFYEFLHHDYDFCLQLRSLLDTLGMKSTIVKVPTKHLKIKIHYSLKFRVREFYVFNLPNKRIIQENNKYNKALGYYIRKIRKTESRPVKCIAVDNESKLYLAGKRLIPTHNTTLAGMLIIWACVFFQKNKAIILNMKKESAIRNVEVIQEILENLPDWMVPKKVYERGEKHVTQIKLWNGSSIKVFFPSTIHKPNTLARALSAPILYIDEAAFISHMREIFEGAAPILFKAQEQAKINNYPYFTFITSTPNGKVGDGNQSCLFI